MPIVNQFQTEKSRRNAKYYVTFLVNARYDHPDGTIMPATFFARLDRMLTALGI